MAINTKGWIGSPWISRDGNVLWFSYSRYNAASVIAGPQRGHSSTDPVSDRTVYATARVKDRWVAPAAWPGNDDQECSGMMFVNSGYSYTAYFHRDFGDGMEICIKRSVNREWSPVKRLGIPHIPGTHDRNPHVSPNHDICVFTLNRDGGSGGDDLWISRMEGMRWSEPQNLGPVINTAEDEDSYFFCGATGEVYFDRGSSIYTCRMTPDGTFTVPMKVDLGLDNASEASTPDDGLSLFFVSHFPDQNRMKIMMATRPDLSSPWGNPTPVD